MTQIRFRIDTVQMAGADQPVQQCTTFATMIAAEEYIVFPKADGTKRLFHSVVIGFCQPIIAVITQVTPLVQYIRECLSQSVFFDSVALFSIIHSCRLG